MRRTKIIRTFFSFALCASLTGCATAAATPSSSVSPSSSTVSSAPSASSTTISNASFTVTFIDVGQGDASLIQCDGENMLIDGGTPDQSQKIYAILIEKGITDLKYIVCTHTHSDHAGGLSGALQAATCQQALTTVTTSTNETFTTFLTQCDKHNVPIVVPQVGDTAQAAAVSARNATGRTFSARPARSASVPTPRQVESCFLRSSISSLRRVLPVISPSILRMACSTVV